MMERRRVEGQFAKEGVETPEPKRAKARSPRPMYCRTFARARVAKALPAIVDKFLEEAMKGSVPHAKAVMVLGGLDKGDVVPKAKRRGRSVASILMEELKRPAPGERKPAGE